MPFGKEFALELVVMDACGVRSAHPAARGLAGAAIAALVLIIPPVLLGQQDPQPRFKTGVDVVSVSATITDANGRFVRDLTRDDFVLYEDGVAQPILYFNNERVPVSLGLALDTSGSMAGDKIRAAQGALSRFLVDLLGPEDEVFVYRFSDEAVLVQGWTTDRRRLPALLGGIQPSGETVLYDTVSESLPLAKRRSSPQEGARRHLRRQRHGQHDFRDRGPARRSGSPRSSSMRSASTAIPRSAGWRLRRYARAFLRFSWASRGEAGAEGPAGACRPARRCRRFRPARGCRQSVEAAGIPEGPGTSRSPSTNRRFAR